MEKQIRDMNVEEVMKMPALGLDDSFEFTCKACGKCCKNRHDILLTPYDLFRIAKYFGRTPQEIVLRYCEVYEGQQSHLPVVRVLPVPPNASCPFLRERKCAVHAKKPVVCRVYPLARMFGFEDGKVRFVYSGASCHHEPKSVTVREWIADVANEDAEQAATLWGEIMTYVYPLILPEKFTSTETRERMMTLLFGGLYLAYDTKQTFVPQLQENFDKLKVIFNGLKE